MSILEKIAKHAKKVAKTPETVKTLSSMKTKTYHMLLKNSMSPSPVLTLNPLQTPHEPTKTKKLRSL
jgi:hypothetical protein